MTSTLLFDWLQAAPPDSSDASFRRIDVSEFGDFDTDIANLIGKALLDARLNAKVAEALRKRLDKAKYAALISEVGDPKRDRTRKGDFGEVVAAHALEALLGYLVPVKKLRYAKVRSGDQPTGIDVVAFKSDESGNRITELCYLESKLRTGANKTFAVEAHDQLELAWQTTAAQYHMFLLNILEGRGDPHFERLCDLMAGVSECETSFWIALHTDAKTWKEEALANLHDRPPSLKPLTVLLHKVRDLSTCVRECFATIGLVPSEDDDD